MGSDRALGHLSAIARNAKSTPLRTHAAAALDRVAADRGLLPEQLDGLLAADLGLDGDPVEYRGVSYLAELGATGGLMLTDPSGLDGLGDLVDSAGAPAGGSAWVRLAHPAIDEFTPWRPWLARQGAPQPFVQGYRPFSTRRQNRSRRSPSSPSSRPRATWACSATCRWLPARN
jgi:hypothetical protein